MVEAHVLVVILALQQVDAALVEVELRDFDEHRLDTLISNPTGGNKMKLKCPKCGAKTRMPDDSKLILAPGLRDETGLNHYHAYCRQCHHVSDLVGAGCLSALMLRPFECVGVIDPQEIKSLSPYAIADLFGGGGNNRCTHRGWSLDISASR